jgi:hypothetical protein
VARYRGLALTRRVAYKDAILSRVSTSSFLVFGILVRIAESNHLHAAVTGSEGEGVRQMGTESYIYREP